MITFLIVLVLAALAAWAIVRLSPSLLIRNILLVLLGIAVLLFSLRAFGVDRDLDTAVPTIR